MFVPFALGRIDVSRQQQPLADRQLAGIRAIVGNAPDELARTVASGATAGSNMGRPGEGVPQSGIELCSQDSVFIL